MSEQFTRGDVVSLLLEVMDWTYVKAHRETPMSEAEKKVLDEVRAALAEPKKERAETGIPARGVGVGSGETDPSRGEAYPTPQPDAKREPATEEVIEAKFEKSFYVHPEALDDFAEGWCEAERFHGIRKEDK